MKAYSHIILLALTVVGFSSVLYTCSGHEGTVSFEEPSPETESSVEVRVATG